MKKLVFLFTVLLVFGAVSIFAQGGGGGQRPSGGGQPSGGGGQPSGGVGQRPEGMPPRQDSTGGQRGQRPEGAGNGQKPEGAGNGQRPEGAGNGQFDKRVLKDIGLTNEQKSQIKQIRKDAKTNNTDPAAVRSQIEGVLTAEQLEKIKARKNKNQPQPQPQPQQ